MLSVRHATILLSFILLLTIIMSIKNFIDYRNWGRNEYKQLCVVYSVAALNNVIAIVFMNI